MEKLLFNLIFNAKSKEQEAPTARNTALQMVPAPCDEHANMPIPSIDALSQRSPQNPCVLSWYSLQLCISIFLALCSAPALRCMRA